MNPELRRSGGALTFFETLISELKIDIHNGKRLRELVRTMSSRVLSSLGPSPSAAHSGITEASLRAEEVMDAVKALTKYTYTITFASIIMGATL